MARPVFLFHERLPVVALIVLVVRVVYDQYVNFSPSSPILPARVLNQIQQKKLRGGIRRDLLDKTQDMISEISTHSTLLKKD